MSGQVLREMGIKIDVSGNGASVMDIYQKKIERTHKSHAFLGRAVEMSHRVMGSFSQRIGNTSSRIGILNKAMNLFSATSARARGMVSNLKKRFDELNPSVNKTDSLLKAVGATILFQKGLNLGKGAVSASAEYEKAHVSLSVFLGSADKATKTMKQLNEFSLRTPFEPREVIAAGRSLLAFGYTAEKLPKTLQMIGDVAAATDIPFKELSQIMGKMKTSVYVQAEELNQLTGRGINAYKELAKVLGTSEMNIKKMASQNMIQYKHLEKAFENMTKKGGQFFGMMDKLAESAAGKWSTFMGFVGEVQRQIGDFIMIVGKPLLTLFNHLLFFLTKNKWAMFFVKMAVLALIPLIGIALAAAIYQAATMLGLFNAALWKTYAAILKPFMIIAFFALLIEDLIIWIDGGKSAIGSWLGPWEKVGWIIKVLVIGAFIALIAIVVFFFGWIPVVVGLAIGLVIALWKAFTGGEGTLKKLWKAILKFFGKAWSWLVKTATKYGRYIIIAIFPLAAFYYYWKEIKNFIYRGFNWIIQQAIKIGMKIFNWLFPGKSIDDVKAGFSRMIKWFKGIPDRIKSALSGIGDAIKEKFRVISKYGKKIAEFFSIKKHIKPEVDLPVEGKYLGGPVAKNRPYVVGEKGPELFVPESSGSIVPNNRLRSAGSAGTSKRENNISISLQINADSMSSIDKIKQAALDGVADALRQAGLNLGVDLDEATA